jgi:geranylgeranyl diphosphate synthase, type II
MTVATIVAELTADRMVVNDYLADLLRTEAVTRRDGPVQRAMRYAVLGAGQRIRPILALRVARLLRAPAARTLKAAAAVELLHCASLIVDDLPCMDNSPTRRDRPSVHIAFGEATAVLASFALVALSARIATESEWSDDDRRGRSDFQMRLLRTLDCSGLIDGQAMDLRLDGSNRTGSCVDVTELKTVPLFEIAVDAATTFATIDGNERALLRCFAREFGLAFQMTDDLLDGDYVDHAMLDDKLTTLRAVVAPFGPQRGPLEELIDFLHARVAEFNPP